MGENKVWLVRGRCTGTKGFRQAENISFGSVTEASVSAYYIPGKIYWFIIVIALDEMHIRALFSFFIFYFKDVAVGVCASAERDQSAPAQTAPPAGGVWLTLCRAFLRAGYRF